MTFAKWLAQWRKENAEQLAGDGEVAMPAIALDRLLRSYFTEYIISAELREREERWLAVQEDAAHPPLVRRSTA